LANVPLGVHATQVGKPCTTRILLYKNLWKKAIFLAVCSKTCYFFAESRHFDKVDHLLHLLHFILKSLNICVNKEGKPKIRSKTILVCDKFKFRIS